jgi:hypothetical protein
MNAAVPLKDRILAAAAATPSLTRRQGNRVVFGVLAVSLAFAICMFELAGGFAHSRDRPLALTLRLADGWAMVSAALAWVVGRKTTPFVQAPELLALLVVGCPFALMAWMSRFYGAYADPLPADHWRCLLATLALAAVPLGGLLWMRRGQEPQYPATLGAAMGAVAGAWSAVVVILWCPDTSPSHALAGHALPLALTIVTGAAAGASVLGIRPSRYDFAVSSRPRDPAGASTGR